MGKTDGVIMDIKDVAVIQDFLFTNAPKPSTFFLCNYIHANMNMKIRTVSLLISDDWNNF
jgi:hypothetical protein